MLDIELIILFIFLGAFVGFIAGMLGVGGGGIFVPVLTSIFIAQGIPIDRVVHLALGTSMASIIVISLSSMLAHHSNANVNWKIVKGMSLGVVVGTFAATFIATNTGSLYLAIFFSLFMAYVSIQMFIGSKPRPTRKLSGKSGLLAAGMGIGGLSALVSIGGGSLTVPYLTWQNIDVKKAIGTSAAIGFPISVAGTIGYVINGWSTPITENYTYGFIYLPAVLFISIASFITAPMGAKVAHKLPVSVLKKTFSLLLIILSIKMLLSVM